jgi:hypothetical protein
MKHLKIYFAILFFSFLGGANAKLMAQPNKISAGESIEVSEDIRQLESFSRQYGLSFRFGNLFVFKLPSKNGNFILELHPNAVKLKVLDDGNLVAYDKDNNVVWQAGTAGRGGKGTHLQLQNDGNLVLYNGTWYGGDGDVLWAAGSCEGKLEGCGKVGPR